MYKTALKQKPEDCERAKFLVSNIDTANMKKHMKMPEFDPNFYNEDSFELVMTKKDLQDI